MMTSLEVVLTDLVNEVKELNKRIGSNGYNQFIGAETSLISSMEELSIKMKRLNQTVVNNPITLEKHKLINKI
jgi:hypothetical protein